MKLAVGLTVSQAIAAYCGVILRKDDCSSLITVWSTITVQAPPVTTAITSKSNFSSIASSLPPNRYFSSSSSIYPTSAVPTPASISSPSSLVESISASPAYGSGQYTFGGSDISSEASTSKVPRVASNIILEEFPDPTGGSDYIVGISLAAVPITTTSVTPQVTVITSALSSETAQIIPAESAQTSSPSGFVISTLTTSVSAPILSTSIDAPTSLLASVIATSQTANAVNSVMVSANIFQPIATSAPPAVLGSRSDHPVPRLGIKPQTSPLDTNKFYANFFLGSQTAGTWTHPYSVAWSKGGGSSSSWGMSVQHIDANQRVFGPNVTANPAQYFINPIGIQSLVISALELGSTTAITTDTLTAFSANVNLLPSTGATPAITFPLVQGMAFVTAIYNGATPIIQTGVFFQSLVSAASPKTGVTKYKIILNDGKTWFLYAWSPTGQAIAFTLVNNGLLQATSNFNGIIQIAKEPLAGGADTLYDTACGVYATSASISGGLTAASASYSLSFAKAGLTNQTLTMFALPHHLQSFDATTAKAVTTVALNTTTKGIATAVVADSWTLVEKLPTTMGFAPWSPALGNVQTLSAAAISKIASVAALEISQNMSAQTNLNSMYYSGKALAKFAQIVYTVYDLLDDPSLAQAGLTQLEKCFAVFASNTQDYPLVYETAWGGAVSSASYSTGDAGVDFGNTYYNDHHFHYGYFVYAAAIIGTLDPSWLTANAPYVNALVRDYANPSTADNYFPVSRMFDWYHGHSWAHGLYETFDGKDQESSSEDSMSAYALKMWGKTIGDANMEARGNLQLAVTARALQNYFLYSANNTVEPPNFIGNKVSGILFENKIDHTTYFGANTEYIQGIHMLPLLPSSTLTRTKQFVQEEWNTYFSSGRADAVVGGWKGVLYANLAIIDPVASWAFFASATFDASWLDGGASQTWYLALAAGLGGA